MNLGIRMTQPNKSNDCQYSLIKLKPRTFYNERLCKLCLHMVSRMVSHDMTWKGDLHD